MSDSDRRWLEVGVRLPADDETASLVVDALLGLGGRAAEERDGWILTHVDSPDDPAASEAAVRAALASFPGTVDLEIRTSWREHEDWAETWKRGLGFRRITERIAVRPSWVPQPDDAPEVVVVIDPGMAFGTAEHGTTRGSLRLLDRAVAPGQRLLDVGSGSGVLAVAAALLGASEVVAIEGDSLACEALAENLELNGVDDRVRWVEAIVDADAVAAYGPVDGLLANIESGILRGLMPGFAAAVKPSGWLVLSGILAGEWPSVRDEAVAAGFEFVEVNEDGEWRSGRFTRLGGAAPS